MKTKTTRAEYTITLCNYTTGEKVVIDCKEMTNKQATELARKLRQSGECFTKGFNPTHEITYGKYYKIVNI